MAALFTLGVQRLHMNLVRARVVDRSDPRRQPARQPRQQEAETRGRSSRGEKETKRPDDYSLKNSIRMSN
jgi:hypothetical protein